jgi:hypothetical protein
MFAPKVANLTECMTVYFVSPHLILMFNKIYTKGVPFCDNFHMQQCWEFE